MFRVGSRGLGAALAVGVAAALVVVSYGWMAVRSATELSGDSAADVHYNLLVEGFQRGQLNLNKTPPAGLGRLADPYDPVTNQQYRLGGGLHDMSYYRGKLYLYFGVTPALLLFWPWAALTGHYLFHRYAVAVFCAVGFLAAAGVLVSLWRRYFAEVGVAVAGAGVLALGLAAGGPILLQRAEFWEVAVSCGYALFMVALGAVWLALQQPARRSIWLAAASLALGLALGARPSLLFGTAIVLIPVWRAWREQPAGPRRIPWRLLAAAGGPLLLCGLGLMLYNQLRFNSPFQFGERYQLAGDRQDVAGHFSPRYLWFDFCVYFLEPAGWNPHFPFVGAVTPPALPPGHAPIEDPYGVLTNIPVLWLALAAPLAWRGRAAAAKAALRGFLGAVTWGFGTSALLLCMFYGTCSRYEVEFLPELTLLAAVGIFGIERATAGWPRGRLLCRTGWGLLLAFSIAFNLLGAVDRYVTQRCLLGNRLLAQKRLEAAIVQYATAARLKPSYAEAHSDLGNALTTAGRFAEGLAECRTAVRLKPDYAKAHDNLGNALLGSGQVNAALVEYATAVRLDPDDATAHYNCGIALFHLGRFGEALAQYATAVRLEPDNPDARYNLGNALLQVGRATEAIAEYRVAVRLRPNFVSARNNLGGALLQAGRTAEAIAEFTAALRLQPDYAEGYNNLGNAFYQEGRIRDAIREYETALRLKPDYDAARENLARMQALLPADRSR